MYCDPGGRTGTGSVSLPRVVFGWNLNHSAVDGFFGLEKFEKFRKPSDAKQLASQAKAADDRPRPRAIVQFRAWGLYSKWKRAWIC